MLNATEKVDFIPYASSFVFELHREEQIGCEYSEDQECFEVKTFFNGEQWMLPGCGQYNCPFELFEKYLLQITYDAAEEAVVCAKDPEVNGELMQGFDLAAAQAENEATIWS